MGYIHVIKTDKPIKIDVESCIKWFKETDFDDFTPVEDITEEMLRERIESFNSEQYVHNENSAGPLPIQMVIEQYIEKELNIPIGLVEVYSDTIITIPSPMTGC
jgi:hypothetical protein